jgi:hypothetical protein
MELVFCDPNELMQDAGGYVRRGTSGNVAFVAAAMEPAA